MARNQLELEGISGADVARAIGNPVAELQELPCETCGVPVVRVWDAIVGHEVLAEKETTLLIIGKRTDGRPLVARPSNGLLLHEHLHG